MRLQVVRHPDRAARPGLAGGGRGWRVHPDLELAGAGVQPLAVAVGPAGTRCWSRRARRRPARPPATPTSRPWSAPAAGPSPSPSRARRTPRTAPCPP
jgi:hypothetical protein